jgi:hypothetical protein
VREEQVGAVLTEPVEGDLLDPDDDATRAGVVGEYRAGILVEFVLEAAPIEALDLDLRWAMGLLRELGLESTNLPNLGPADGLRESGVGSWRRPR